MKCDVEITNMEQFKKELSDIMQVTVEDLLIATLHQIRVETLNNPKFSHGMKKSSIANDLVVERVEWNHYRLRSKTNLSAGVDVWELLDVGTGIYNPEHAGQGPGGRIVPIHGAKALHFKSEELARVLGFPDENVYLASVKGVAPRHFFAKYTDDKVSDMIFSNIHEVKQQIKEDDKLRTKMGSYTSAFSFQKG